MMIDKMRQELKLAMKDKRQNDKEVVQLIIGRLALKEKEKRAPLTESEEFEVLAKEIKQMNDTFICLFHNMCNYIRDKFYTLTKLTMIANA